MWKLVVIVLVSMTFADVCASIHVILLTAMDNKIIFKLRRWEYRKHDLSFFFDGLADIGGAFGSVGSGLSLLSVTRTGSHLAVGVNLTGWTVLSVLALMVGSQLGGSIGDVAAKYIVGEKTREIRSRSLTAPMQTM